MARSADPKCIWASVSNTIKADAEIPDNNRKARAMVRICEKEYPSATPLPVPEIWKIGPAFPGVPRWGSVDQIKFNLVPLLLGWSATGFKSLRCPGRKTRTEAVGGCGLTECCPVGYGRLEVGAGSAEGLDGWEPFEPSACGARVLGKAGGPRAPAPYLNPNSPCIMTATLRNGPVSQAKSLEAARFRPGVLGYRL